MFLCSFTDKSFLSRLLSFRSVRKSNANGRKRSSGNGKNKAQTGSKQMERNDKAGTKPLITHSSRSKNDDINDNKDDEVETRNETSKSKDGEVDGGGSNKLATISTQTSFSIENLNSDLALLSLVPPAPQSKASTLDRDREDSDSGRCTDSHSDADAEIAAALNRSLSPTSTSTSTLPFNHFHPHHHQLHHCHERRENAIYEKIIESDLASLKVDVSPDDELCDGRSPRSPTSSSHLSVSPSPSTSTFTTVSGSGLFNRGNSNYNRYHNLYGNNRCHSSASSTGGGYGYSYRDFYNMYRRRYPSYGYINNNNNFNYQQPPPTPSSLGRESGVELMSEGPSSPTSLKFKPPQPIRYPPRNFERKQIFDEITGRSSFREKKSQIKNSPKSVVTKDDLRGFPSATQTGTKLAENVLTSSNSNNCTAAITSRPGSTSTILTQTVKNSTNLELEFKLPLGNIISAAMGARGGGGGSINVERNFSSKPLSTTSLSNDKSAPEHSSLQSDTGNINNNESETDTNIIGGKRERELTPTSNSASTLSSSSSTSKAEVNTTVNDLFTIKSFVKMSPNNIFNDELSSTIEFKTKGSSRSNGNNVNGNFRDISNNSKNNLTNNGNHHHHQRHNMFIEAVSSKPKPFIADDHLHTKFNRESEII